VSRGEGCSPESETKPREVSILGESRSHQVGRRPCVKRVIDEREASPRCLRRHRVCTTVGEYPGERRARALGEMRNAVPEYGRQCNKRGSNGRVASDEDRYAAMVSDEEG